MTSSVEQTDLDFKVSVALVWSNPEAYLKCGKFDFPIRFWNQAGNNVKNPETHNVIGKVDSYDFLQFEGNFSLQTYWVSSWNGPCQANLVLIAYASAQSLQSRGTFRQKARSLASLNGWACAVKIYHDGMLEYTNSLDWAQMIVANFSLIRYKNKWKTSNLFCCSSKIIFKTHRMCTAFLISTNLHWNEYTIIKWYWNPWLLDSAFPKIDGTCGQVVSCANL